MDRSFAMLLLLSLLVSVILLILALLSISPIFWSSVISLLYTLSYFMLNESHEVHNAQEYENRFWTIFAVLFSTALFFAADSPIAIGSWNPSLGFISVLLAGYAMHVWDRNTHRLEVGRLVHLKRGTATSSLNKLQELGIPIEEQLKQLDECLKDIDQTFIPSTINNFINRAYVIRKEQEIISIFEEAVPSSLNYLICNSQLPLIFYKIKDHHNFKHHHRSQIIELLSIERIAHLNVVSRVVVLHALQIMKLPANMKAEHCVRNIILSTYQDDLSELKTLSDAKGDYYSFVKLVFDDIKSDIVRDEILKHIRTQANVQNQHMLFKTKRSRDRKRKFWRKILSDVDDTLSCSGGSYPSGIDKRYGKKVIYPGVLGFYRELDLGVDGPLEWPSHTAGNLVFLSARPHVYKDVSEKINYAKFEKLKERGMHTTPSLLAGDINSGLETVFKNDFEPLAQKKFKNFKQYVSIYPEFRHVFVCDNGQGDLRAAELMVDAYPKEIEAIYVHEVQPRSKTYKYNPDFWTDKPVKPFFFRTYIEAALDAARRRPPLLQIEGLRRICVDAINDFYLIQTKSWPSQKHKWDRFDELNQSLYHANMFLQSIGFDGVPLLEAERLWKDNQKVRTPYGIGTIIGFDPQQDLYDVVLDWRPLVMQVQDAISSQESRTGMNTFVSSKSTKELSKPPQKNLETVFETEEEVMQITGQNTAQTNEDSRVRSSKDVSTSPPAHVLDSESIALDSIPALEDEVIEWEKKHVITAKIKARYITKYTPPTLPILPNEGKKSSFSFWTSSTKVKPKPLFSKNDKCTTPYGCGAVLEYRVDTRIVVIEITGWHATCYLQADMVKPVTEGFFNNLLKMISTETKASSQTKTKEYDTLYSAGSIISTPFGQGRVVRPPKEKQQNTVVNRKAAMARYDTIALSLFNWTLSNGTSPILYSTTESMISWQGNTNVGEKSAPDNSFLSAFGTIAQGVKHLMVGKTEKFSDSIPSDLVDQYYTNGATVVTPFGDGIVEEFRASDGMYRIALRQWKLCDGKNAKFFSKKENLRSKIALGCKEGDPVFTSLGLTGNLVSVEAKSGIHIVAVPSTHMICYLQAADVLRPLKAAVLDPVMTPFGEGTVVKYRFADNMYEIQLQWNAQLFARPELFERKRINKEEKGGFSWVFRFLFSDNRMKISKDNIRSRSNSIV